MYHHAVTDGKRNVILPFIYSKYVTDYSERLEDSKRRMQSSEASICWYSRKSHELSAYTRTYV